MLKNCFDFFVQHICGKSMFVKLTSDYKRLKDQPRIGWNGSYLITEQNKKQSNK